MGVWTLAAGLLASTFFYIKEPVVNMREAPTQDALVVSQALCAEEVSIQERAEDWSLISTPDGYSGWVLSDTLASRSEPYAGDVRTARLKAHLYGVKDVKWGPICSLPIHVDLKVLDADDPRWLHIALPDGTECYVQKGDVTSDSPRLAKEDLVAFSQQFLGLPYTWGGRSSFGYDCSGFVQMLYGRLDIALQRDARQQIRDSRFKTIPIDQLEPGDLLFFGPSEESIQHVGIYLGDGQFIHATARENQPWIRISKLIDFEWNGGQEAYYSYRLARQFLNPR